MNERSLYFYFKAIVNDSNVRLLTREGISFKQIASMIPYSINEGYIVEVGDKITLSEKGMKFYETLNLNYKNINKDTWIDKDKKSQVAKLDKNALFLPRQDELTF